MNRIALLFLLALVPWQMGALAQCSYSIASVSSPTTCFGNADGTAQVSITPTTDDTSPYTLEWFDNDTSPDRAGLSAGTYFFRITDATGCTRIDFVTISEAEPIIIEGNIQNNACHGDATGAVTVRVAGGAGNYRYTWTSSDITKDIQNMPAGVYSLTVADGNGCTQNGDFIIEEPPALLLAINTTDASCSGKADGTARAVVTGGVQPYLFDWSTGDKIPEARNLAAGTYTLTVTDQNLCSSQQQATIDSPLPLTVMLDARKASCFDVADGEIQAQVTGGTSPYRYRWSSTSIVLGDNSANPKDLTKDTYTLLLTDARGCEETATIAVAEPNPLVINLDKTDARCFDENSGMVNLTISGGTPAYQVLWSTGLRAEDITAVKAGVYTVVVVDKEGCTEYGEIEIGQPDQFDFGATVTNLSCRDHHDGSIELNLRGGTPTYQILWSNGTLGTSATDLPSGDYEVQVTDAQGCSYASTFAIEKTDIACISKATVPNAFTPNADGFNDEWVIDNHELYPRMEIHVVNKWGKRVFESTGYNKAWDGRVNGIATQDGTYYYTINLHNGDTPFSGTLTIVR